MIKSSTFHLKILNVNPHVTLITLISTIALKDASYILSENLTSLSLLQKNKQNHIFYSLIFLVCKNEICQGYQLLLRTVLLRAQVSGPKKTFHVADTHSVCQNFYIRWLTTFTWHCRFSSSSVTKTRIVKWHRCNFQEILTSFGNITTEKSSRPS